MENELTDTYAETPWTNSSKFKQYRLFHAQQEIVFMALCPLQSLVDSSDSVGRQS